MDGTNNQAEKGCAIGPQPIWQQPGSPCFDHHLVAFTAPKPTREQRLRARRTLFGQLLPAFAVANGQHFRVKVGWWFVAVGLVNFRVRVRVGGEVFFCIWSLQVKEAALWIQ